MSPRSVFIIASGIMLLAACDANRDIRSRYLLEKQLWSAEHYQSTLFANFERSTDAQRIELVSAYNEILQNNPLHDGDGHYRPQVASDIQRIITRCKMRLLSINYLAYRYEATMFENSEQRSSKRPRFGVVRMRRTTTLFAGTVDDSTLAQCEKLLIDLTYNEEVWQGESMVDDALLSIPLCLLRVAVAGGDDASIERLSDVADRFYSRVLQAWPHDRHAADAYVFRARAAFIVGNHHYAVSSLEPAVSADTPSAAAEMLRAAYLFQLGEDEAALSAYDAIVRNHPREIAEAATLEIARLQAGRHRYQAALDITKTLERDARSDNVRASAMLLRARILQREGFWQDALTIHRRLEQRYPYSEAALHSPVATVRHYRSLGDTAGLERALTRATAYYVRLLERGSAMIGEAATIVACLAECYAEGDGMQQFVTLVDTNARRWSNDAATAALYVAANACVVMLDDPDRAAALLEKSIELFPETRYSRVARNRLNIIYRVEKG